MRIPRAFLFSLAAALLIHAADVTAATRVKGVRAIGSADSTQLVLDLSAPGTFRTFTLDSPARVVIDLDDSQLADGIELPRSEGPIIAVRSGVQPGGVLRIVIETSLPSDPQVARVAPSGGEGHRLVVTIAPRGGSLTPSLGNSPRVVAAPHAPSEGTRPVIIAVDAGHGGADPGATGKAGTREKTVVLDIARAVVAQINEQPGMRAVLTRDGDYYIAHRERIRRARAAKADLFLSIHADAVGDREVSGASVYVLSERGATDEAARWLASRENAADLKGGVSLGDKDNVLASVLMDLSQSANISASMAAAERVLIAMNRVGDVRKPRVQQAGFLVLKSPDIPSMLVETAYISNPREEKQLRSSSHQDALAEAIVAGVRSYFTENPPEGTRFAALRRVAGNSPAQPSP